MTGTDTRIDHLDIARAFAVTPEEWVVAPRFHPAHRWYHRLAVADDHEVWLLTWLPGQSTDLHDHGGSAGAFHVYAGTLTEEIVPPTASPPGLTAHELAQGEGHRFGSHHIHRIANRSTRPAISIHVYGPAPTTMTRYRIGPAGLEIDAVDQAGAQW
jgi:predicted metal-dependent enzyme (double-stranded beta helix superfamily)